MHWRVKRAIKYHYLKIFFYGTRKKWYRNRLRSYLKKKFGFKIKKIGNRQFSNSGNLLNYLSYRRRRLRKRKLRRLVP